MARRHHAAKHVQIDQRLSRAGHALQQDRSLDRRPQDPLDHAALVGSELRRRRRRQPRERIARPGDIGVARQALSHQPVERRRGELELGHEVAQRSGAAERLQRLVRDTPLGRASKGALALEQRRQRRGEHQHPLRALGGPRRTLDAPQRARQERAQGQPHGRAVVAADPETQFEQRGPERRRGVGRRDDGLRRHRGTRGGRIHPDDEANHAAPLQRHHHPGSGHDPPGELSRDLVGVGAGNRDREDDGGEPGGSPRARARGQQRV